MLTGGRRIASAVLLIGLAIGALLVTGTGVAQSDDGQRPELHPTTLLLQPASPVGQGTTVRIAVKLENSGPISADGFRVEFFLRPRSDEADGSQSWSSFAVVERSGLSPEAQEIELSATLDTSDPDLIPNPGVYELRVLVDSNDQIPELDEANNELRTSLIVSASNQGRPDLRPLSVLLEPPSPVSLSDTVTMAATVANTGDRDASPFEVSFSYCRLAEGGQECASDYQEFDRRNFSGGLPDGASQSVDAQLNIPELGLASGRYLIRIAVDPTSDASPTGQISEQDEANNVLTTGLFVQGPELTPTGMRFSPSSPHIGETIEVTASVKNVGTGSATNIPVAFFIDGIQFALPTVTLADNESADVTALLRTSDLNLSPGSQTIRVVVDPNNQVAERDETNNEIRTSIRLLEAVPQRPELRPKRIVFSPTSPVALGRTQSLAVLGEVLNTGEVAAQDFLIDFDYRPAGSIRWLDIPCSTNCEVDTLQAGARIEANAELDLRDLNPGRYEVRVTVDPTSSDRPDGAIRELDEFNNVMRTSVSLLAARLPDLTFDSGSFRVDPGLEIRHGESVRLAIDVVNVGEGVSEPSEVELSARPIEAQSGTAFATRDVPRLGPGERHTLNVTLNTNSLPAGPNFYEVEITADPDNDIDELDEGNNVFTTGSNPQNAQPLFVRGPDLTVTGFRFDDTSISPINPRVTRGESVPLTLDVTNIGVEASNAFRVSYCVQSVNQQQGTECETFRAPQSQRDDEQVQFPGLGVQTTVQSRTVLDTSDLTPGTYRLVAEVDASESVQEENELNNVGSQQLTVMARPDLTVPRISFDPPSPISTGANLTVFADVLNRGAGATRVPFEVGIGVRPLGETQCQAEATREIGSLAQQQQVTVSARFDADRLSTGGFEVCVTADVEGVIPESDEANNLGARRLIVGQFDLAVEAITFDPQPPILDDDRGEMTIFADIGNLGDGPVLDPFNVDFALRRVAPQAQDGFQQIDQARRSGLQAGSQSTVKTSINTSGLACGTYELAVSADPENRLNDPERANNQALTRFSVCPPDIVLNQITFEPQPPLAVGSDELKLFADVRNLGDGPVIDPFAVNFELRRVSPEPAESFRSVGQVEIDGLEAGTQAAAKIEIATAELVPGTYELRVTADGTNAIRERNEENNAQVVQFEIGPPRPEVADLTVSSFTVDPSSVMAGNPVEVVAEIANVGRQDAGSFQAVFFWKRANDARRVNFANFQINGLDAGERRTLTHTLDSSILWVGNFDLIVVLDNTNRVDEADEGNNQATTPLTVTAD